MNKNIFGALAEMNKAFHRECIKREREIPGSYAVVTEKYVSRPVSNAAFRAAIQYRKDQEATAIAAGVSSEVWRSAASGKNGLALSQCLPCLEELETKGLLTLLVKGEADSRGVSREHAVGMIFNKYFPISKDSVPKIRYSMLNKRANCRAFASALSVSNVNLRAGAFLSFSSNPTAAAFEVSA